MKVKFTNEYGRDKAEKLFGAPSKPDMTANYTPVQAPEDRHAANYDNDASGWVRGEGGTAENKPGGFDHHKDRR